MYMLEKNFKQKVRKRLNSVPDLYYFVKEAVAIRGIPDIIGCYKGTFFAWELKRSEKEANKKTGRIVLQRHNLSKIKSSGGIGEIVYPENFECAFSSLIDHLPTSASTTRKNP